MQLTFALKSYQFIVLSLLLVFFYTEKKQRCQKSAAHYTENAVALVNYIAKPHEGKKKCSRAYFACFHMRQKAVDTAEGSGKKQTRLYCGIVQR